MSRDPEKRRAANRAFRERYKARIESDPDFAEAERAKSKAKWQRYKERCHSDPEFREKARKKNTDIWSRYRDKHRHDDFYRLRMVYAQRVQKCIARGLPYAPQDEWMASLPPRPEDTDLWEWALKAIDPSKGLVPGNFKWVRHAKDKALDKLTHELNIGCGGDDKTKRKRLCRIAHRDGLENVSEVSNSPRALAKERASPIDHTANIGRFFGYSLRVVDIDMRQSASSINTFYILRCSVCGRKFARAAVRILGTRKIPANTDCPHCHGHATQSLLRAKNSGYYEIKRKLHNIVVREDIAHESLSHYTLRSTSMEFTELVIDAELSGRIDMMRQIYAI